MKEEINLQQMLDAVAAEGRARRLAQRDSADLPLWCRRRQRCDTLLRYAAAACWLLLLSFSSGTLMASQMAECPMNVSTPFQQVPMYKLSIQIVEAL